MRVAPEPSHRQVHHGGTEFYGGTTIIDAGVLDEPVDVSGGWASVTSA